MCGIGRSMTGDLALPLLAPDPVMPVTPLARRPTFSVVIAAYQAARFAPEAVASALGQSYSPMEVIVIDDGSTDGLAEALAPYERDITVIRQSNRGEAAARNAGVRVASGDYVVILDADDTWMADRLARMGEALRLRPDLDVLATDAWVEKGGEVVRRLIRDNRPFPAENQRREILLRNFIFVGCAVRRRTWQEAGGMREIRGHIGLDWDMWRRLILGGSLIGMVDEPLARYRRWEGSMTADRERELADRIRIHLLSVEDPRLSGDERRLLRSLAARERVRLAALSADRALPETRRRLLDVISHRPFLQGNRTRFWAGRVLVGFPAEPPKDYR